MIIRFDVLKEPFWMLEEKTETQSSFSRCCLS